MQEQRCFVILLLTLQTIVRIYKLDTRIYLFSARQKLTKHNII